MSQTKDKKPDLECGRSEQHFPLSLLRRAFPDPALEKLYLSYSNKQKRDGLHCFLLAAILYDVYYLAVPCDIKDFNWPMAGFLLSNSVILLWCLFGVRKCSTLWLAIPHVSWSVFVAQLLIGLFLKRTDVTGRDNLGWVVLMDYLLYVLLPLRLRYCVLLSIGICVSYTIAIARLAENESHLTEQLCANLCLLLAANILGITTYFLSDKQQRQAFLETRQSLEMKMLIEEQSAEQERLLLSVLPEHVAVKMRQDLGSALDSQFKKIYMSRHENVSILYADIVGFTAISSTYSASELVKILNELFARFDRLSEKYQQLRIKILGDCYYCISGAPRERPDHAVLCVHMGLSMVKAIKYVQQTCNSPVDMRVGIHTGAVLAGVLGQRQWQFDVYSKDVELANKMESSGKPGRVHISEKTLSFLNGEFEVEPAFGEKREEALRLAGIKTYFIVKVLKPFRPPNTDIRNGSVADDGTQGCDTDFSDVDNDFEHDNPQDEENQKLNNEKTQDGSEDFKQRLREELINKGGLSTLSDHTTCFTLSFKSSKKESDFNHNKETAATVSILGCPLVLLFISIAQFLTLPRDELSILSFTTGFTILVVFSLIAVAELKPSAFPRFLVSCSTTANNVLWARRTLAAVAILILGCVNAVDMVTCNVMAVPRNDTETVDIAESCLYPSYFSYFCVLVLVAASLPTQISHLLKIAIFFVIVAIHCIMNIFVISEALNCEAPVHPELQTLSNKYALCSMLVCIALSLSFLARYVEKATRVLFQWKTEVEEQREKASDIGSRNEALVYNILPPHVAVHFLGNKKRQHEELYSQSYAEVGVLFASMPNFSDFYSEESVNNQGLECLRFLNEVISDFDAILQLPQYQDIIKIKTIGSTYMAASGLNPSKTVKVRFSST
ncbi:UNVERIFIED_CONTAM: hypothetical protein PYX00_006878 [Menopon gallinae]|uniref:adenylate cyclase n=1 Tax=Menopon gallinae TaxID=328185 RepID=A0AAW2HWY6_9NEOP